MNRRTALKIMGSAIPAFSLSTIRCASKSTPERPNIILMVADNLGRESVGYYGSHIFKTPHLDRMASEGVIFDNCLIATPLCSPARCGWNTGRHPFRVGINGQTQPSDPDSGLALEEKTIAEALKDAGYYTALFGKWNLGYDKKFNPLYQGFDEFYGSNAGHADYFTHLYNKDMKSHFFRGIEPVNDEGYFDELFTDEAISFLRRRKGRGQPFYLNLPFYAPHGPYQAPPGYYHNKDPMVNYRFMIEYLDLCVGRIIDEVDKLGMAENTLIVFLSDQGSSSMNTHRRELTEGGLKVVCNAKWTGKIPEGVRVETPWIHCDLYTTFVSLAGGAIPTDREVDGEDVWPLFEGKELEHDRTMFWTYRNEDAVRIGDWKLHLIDGKVKGLYDLADDPEEKKDLSERFPDKVAEMTVRQAEWKTVCAANQTSFSKSGRKYSNPNHNNNYN